ncbi:MAG: PEP-CTERM sorting domain-containing protein [Planctomycetota bacterium]
MRLSTARLLTCLSVPMLTVATASAQLRFEELLVNGTGDANDFFEFSAQSAADLGPGAALIVISGNESTAGNITSFLDLNIDFTNPSNTFPTNNLFFAQPIVVSGAQTDPSGNLPPGIVDYNPDADPATYFLGGGDALFPVFEPSATYALVGGFTGSLSTDLDSDNDGTVDGVLPFTTVYDAVTLLASENNIQQLADGSETTPRFTGKGYADDFSAAFPQTPSAAYPQGNFAFFDQRYDEFVGISPDGPDGFFRFTDGTPAAYDLDVNTAGIDFIPGNEDDSDGSVFGFDGTTAGGVNEGSDEEIIFIQPNGDVVDSIIPSDLDPSTPGDQSLYLTPGSANNIVRPTVVGDVLPAPVPQGLEIVTDFVKFAEERVAIAGERIAGTSFENETAANYTVFDESDPNIGDVNGDGDETDQLIGFSEAFNGDDINGDGDFTDVLFVGYKDQRTNSGGNSAGGDPQPLGDTGAATGTRVRLLNDPNSETGTTVNGVLIDNRIQYDGDDDTIDTADDVFIDSVISAVNSTASSAAAGDLGYVSDFIDTRTRFETGFGENSGDVLGPVDFDFLALDPTVGGVNDGRDGSNAFVVDDPDGTLQITFDTVDLSNYEDVTFQALIGANDTGYEAEDLIQIELLLTTSEGDETVEVLYFEGGNGLEGIGILGELTAAAGEIGQFTTPIADEVLAAQAIITFGSSSGAENYLLDDVAFFGTLVTTTGLVGDYDDSGQVEQGDLNLVLNNWGLDAPFASNGDPFASSQVDQEELNRVLNNWGDTTVSPDLSGFTVPEPASAALVMAGLGLLARRRRIA